MKLSIKAQLWRGGAIITTFLPICTYMGIFYDKFFGTVSSGTASGAIILSLVAAVTFKDKFGEVLKNNALLKISIVGIILLTAIQAIASQLIMLFICTASGAAVSIFPEYKYKQLKKQIEMQENAQIAANATAIAIKQTITELLNAQNRIEGR